MNVLTLSFSHTNTHTRARTHTNRKISMGHCKPRRHRHWGPFWLAKTERNVLRPQCGAVDRSLPRRLPLPPSTSETKTLALPLGVSLSFAPSPLSLPSSTSLLFLSLSSFPPSDPLLFFSDASWSRPSQFACVGEAVQRRRSGVTVSQTQQRWRGSGWGEDQRVGLGLWLACPRLEQTGNTAASAAGGGAGGGEGHSCKCGVATIYWMFCLWTYLYTEFKLSKY